MDDGEDFVKELLRWLGMGIIPEPGYTAKPLSNEHETVSPDDLPYFGEDPGKPAISDHDKQQKALANKGYGAFTSTGFTDQRTIQPETVFGDGKYSPHYTGNLVWGDKRATHVAPSKDNIKEPDEDEDDYMNQLLAAALMALPKSGKPAPTAGGVGSQVPFGNPWTMRAPWEKDYRYLIS